MKEPEESNAENTRIFFDSYGPMIGKVVEEDDEKMIVSHAARIGIRAFKEEGTGREMARHIPIPIVMDTFTPDGIPHLTYRKSELRAVCSETNMRENFYMQYDYIVGIREMPETEPQPQPSTEAKPEGTPKVTNLFK